MTLGYLYRDMHVPNNKNIIFLLDSRKRKFKTSNSDCWKFSNRIDTVDLRLCPREHFPLFKSLSRLVLCYKRIGPSCCTLFTFITCYSLQIALSQNYLLPIIFSACREYLTENSLSFPSAPRWVRHSYLSKGL